MEKIIQAFEGFMGENGRYFNEFYIGIATDPVDRLENGHGVDTSIPHLYWNQPLQTLLARAIEKYFLGKGAKGGPGGGDEQTCYVYTYKITPQTRE